ncbi:hypothetical protein GGX14DRAFT_398141 [Mycena pura]|uniref:Uncharacterized protein n=1 Tax=Mycena pura TaxID=153505 RepID=A0AAD6Y876_9AGAR|nr:hypothetical protein GGX14DRAFT_398141 [Mycena pura]
MHAISEAMLVQLNGKSAHLFKKIEESTAESFRLFGGRSPTYAPILVMSQVQDRKIEEAGSDFSSQIIDPEEERKLVRKIDDASSYLFAFDKTSTLLEIGGMWPLARCKPVHNGTIDILARDGRTNPSNIPSTRHCRAVHWKYNFRLHLEHRHPNWQNFLTPDCTFLSSNVIKQLVLKIQPTNIIDWLPLHVQHTTSKSTATIDGPVPSSLEPYNT